MNGYIKAFLLCIMAAAPKKLIPEIIKTIRGVVMEFDEETNKVLEEIQREFFKDELESALRENEQRITRNIILQGMDNQTIRDISRP
ncbi:MAG: hypothetical protein ACLFQB_14310 [Chitinispirillaceae bacterium]